MLSKWTPLEKDLGNKTVRSTFNTYSKQKKDANTLVFSSKISFNHVDALFLDLDFRLEIIFIQSRYTGESFFNLFLGTKNLYMLLLLFFLYVFVSCFGTDIQKIARRNIMYLIRKSRQRITYRFASSSSSFRSSLTCHLSC